MSDDPEPKKQKTEEAPAAEAPAEAPAESTASFTPGEAPSKGAEAKMPETAEEVAAAVLKQVEFYFSDKNFAKDKFLKEETAKSPEQWVNISVLSTFNRMKVLVPSLDLAVIADALKTSTAVEVSEDGTKVRRTKSRWDKMLGGVSFGGRQEMVTYAKGLIEAGKTAPDGELSNEAQAFVLDLLKFHASPAEKEGAGVKAVKVGCNPEFPDTSCFVIVRVDGTEADFSYIKCIGNIFPDEPFSGKGGRGGKRKADGEAGSPGGSAKKQQTDAGASSAQEGDAKTEAGVSYTKGCIVVLKELKEGSDVMAVRGGIDGEDKSGGVRFVEIVPDMPLAYVRFDSAESAATALAKGTEYGAMTLLEGADEEQYWDKIGAASKGGKGGKGGKGKGKGGKGKGKGGKGRGKGGGRGGGRK